VIAAAEGGEIGNALRAATDEARTLGIFGSPTFVVGREIFWGDDRLDDALAWHRSGTLGRV
jgi:2-hydroxychromene-2-carboxylate isomerase